MAESKKQSQALAIKLSRERRSGKEVPVPPRGRYSEKTRRRALRDLEAGRQRCGSRHGSDEQSSDRAFISEVNWRRG